MVLNFNRTENRKAYLILVQAGPSSNSAVCIYT